tara:strand:+ start:100 stop:246 length:147 start_codon:yes stop_codon:yes gene_type:complete
MYLSASPKGALAETRARWAVSRVSKTAISGADRFCLAATTGRQKLAVL